MIAFECFVAEQEKINFSQRFSMVCDASWVQHPSHFNLSNMGRSFTIKVDGRGLPDGPHYTEVRNKAMHLIQDLAGLPCYTKTVVLRRCLKKFDSCSFTALISEFGSKRLKFELCKKRLEIPNITPHPNGSYFRPSIKLISFVENMAEFILKIYGFYIFAIFSIK